MKRMMIITCLTLAMALVGCGREDQPAESTDTGDQNTTLQDVQEQTEQAGDAIAGYAGKTKDKVVAEMQQQWDQMKQQVDALDQQMEAVGADTRKTLADARDELAEQMDNVEQQMAELKNASADAWNAAAKNLNAAMKDAQAAYTEAINELTGPSSGTDDDQ